MFFMANYHRSAVVNLPSYKWTKIETRREKAGPNNNGTKSFTAEQRWRKKRQLKRKFFLFITLKIHPKHIKFLLWNSSLCVPLIPPIIIFLSVLPLLHYSFEGARCFGGNTAAKNFYVRRLEFYGDFSVLLLLSFLFITVNLRKQFASSCIAPLKILLKQS